MPDPQPAATISPVPTGPVQPATTQADDGYERISRDELQTLRRNNERARGMEGFFQEASKRGFKRSEDFGAFDKFSETLKGKKLTLEQMTSILNQNEEAQAQGSSSAMDPAALKKFMDENGYVTKSALDERETLIGARFSHKSAMESEQKLIEKYVEDLTGQEAGAFEKAQIKAMLAYNADQKRGLYPDGHPLSKEALAAHNEQSLGEIVAEIKKMKEAAKGEALAAKGAAVNNGARGSVAGGGGSKQPAKPSDKDDDDAPIGSPAHKAQVERYAASLAAKRGQGPVSAAGG